MTSYYVRKTGNNSNNGTSPATAWLTIGKALASGSPVTAGDTVYVGAGIYYEVITVAVSGASGNPITVTADVDGAQTGDSGPVIWSNWIGASGFSGAPSASAGTCLSTNAQDDLTFNGFTFIGGGSSTNLGDIVAGSFSALRWIFNDCAFYGGKTTTSNGQIIRLTYDSQTNGGSAGWRWNRCIFANASNNGITLINQTHATGNGNADWDVDVEFRDCLFMLCNINIETLSGLAFKGGGVRVIGCSGAHATLLKTTGATGHSTTIPNVVKNCYAFSTSGGALIQGGATGQIIEDWNLLYSSSPRVNTASGTNSVTTATGLHITSFGTRLSPLIPESLLELGVPLYWGGTQITTDLWRKGHEGATASTVDNFNISRPSGGRSLNNASGAFEAHDVATTATDQFDVAPSLVLVGPSDHTLSLVLPMGTNTISIKVRYDTVHTSATPPQVRILANGELGIADQTLTMTAAADTWETLTFSPITLPINGVIKLRLVNRSSATNGQAWFDTLSIV
jgi:hypothetical protein